MQTSLLLAKGCKQKCLLVSLGGFPVDNKKPATRPACLGCGWSYLVGLRSLGSAL
jgi:hypothetical protein